MNEKYIIGIDFEGITLKLNDIISYILILDTAGQESIVIYSFRSSDGFIFVSDIYGEEDKELTIQRKFIFVVVFD